MTEQITLLISKRQINDGTNNIVNLYIIDKWQNK